MATLEEIMNSPSPFAKTAPPAPMSIEDIMRSPDPFAPKQQGGPQAPPRTIQNPPAVAVQEQKDAGLRANEAKGEESSDEGFWSLVGRSALQGAIESSQEVAAGAAATVPQALGGSTLEQQAAQFPAPDAQDELTKLNSQGVVEGFTNPRWWGAYLARTAGGVAPLATITGAGALAGGAIAGPPGAAIGGALGASGGMALQQLVPSYKAARARGLDHDAAVSEAIEASGISAAFGAAMGLVGMTPLTGTTSQVMANGTIKNVLARPISEALLKIGVVEPGLMDLQQQAIKAAGPGGWITPDEGLTTHLSGMFLGGLIHASSVTLPVVKGALGSVMPASEHGIGEAFGAVQGEGRFQPQPEVPHWPTGGEAYNLGTDAIANHPEATMEAHEWHTVLSGAHSDFDNVELPFWLADDQGKIAKDDLLAFVETRRANGGVFTHGNSNIYRDPNTPDGFYVPLAENYTEQHFSALYFTKKGDRDNDVAFHITGLYEDPTMKAKTNIKSPSWDILALSILEKAANWSADKITYGALAPDFQRSLIRWANMLGAQKGTTRFAGDTQDYPYIKVSPALAAKVRTGTTLFSRSPGTYTVDDPFKQGREAITKFLDDAKGGARNEWVQTPEGGQGMYLRSRRDGLVDVANVDFDKKGTGAFTHYLDHLEQEVARRGLKGVRVENIMNKRLVPFLESRGYVKENDPFGFANTPSMRKEGIQPHAVSEGNRARAFPTAGQSIYTPGQLKNAANRAAKLLDDLRRAMGMKVPVIVNIHEQTTGDLGNMTRTHRGYEINLYLSPHEKSGAEGIYTTLAHEFGHVVMYHFFDRSPMAIKNTIADAFERWRQNAPPDQTFNQLGRRRNPHVDQYYGSHWLEPDQSLLSLTPERQRYWAGFEEWFAEQVSRWATTDEKPGDIMERSFFSLGQRIKSVLEKFKGYLQGERPKLVPGMRDEAAFQPVPEMTAWLSSLMKDAAPFAADVYAAAQLRSLRQNARAFREAGEDSVDAIPETLSTASGRGLLSRLFGRAYPGREMAAGADKFNWFYNLTAGIMQLAKLNPHITGLQRYRELNSMMSLEKTQMMYEAEQTLRLWRALHPAQADNLARLIDDYMNMTYRSPTEVRQKVTRKPNAIEFQELVRRNAVSDRGLAVFQKIVGDFDKMLDRYRLLLEQGANEIKDAHGDYDPVASADAMAGIAEQIDKMRKGPYFPAMRFGNFTLTVKNGAGSVVHFETFESQRRRDLAAEEARRSFPEDHFVRTGALAKDVAPLVGMPPGLLDKIADKLDLSPTQREALEQLRFEYMPAQSFAHRFRRRRDVPGYSTDFLRAYAYYMFHGSNYFTRAKYVDALREAHKGIKEESKTLETATKRDQIANYVGDHLHGVLNPKVDFTLLRSAIFHYALGFSPAAATLNLSQTIFGTYPYLASKFGSDVRAIAAMGNASRKLSTFYSKENTLASTDPELKGIREAIRQGLISETQANVLAATADGRVLSQGFGGNRAEKAWNLFSRASQFFFEMTEQTNRRVAFRAAWDLAMSDPGNAHVKNMVGENKILYDALRLKGFTEQEAGAFVTAKDAVESTQYVYAPWTRPRIFRGKLGSLFVFHSFTQNTLYYMWNNPGAMARSLFMLAAVGGMMGLPGMEDANGLIRGLAYRLFGKDFDLQDLARQFVVDVLKGGASPGRPGDLTAEGVIRPDILLHGLSRVGYGIPALLDTIGTTLGLGHIPFPVSDRHASVSMGNILPVPPGQLLAPEITGPGAGKNNIDSSIEQSSQKAAGAIFGFGFALYKAITALPTLGGEGFVDWKRWEHVMPTALRNASQAARFYSEGKARNAQGAATVRFDPNEPEQAMELIGKALGYQPERLSAQWDLNTAEKEQQAYWDIRREYLMRSAWTAKQSQDPEVYHSALASIKAFNKMLPQEAKGKAITSDALREAFTNRGRQNARTEVGLPGSNRAVPLARSVQRLYPEASPTAGKKYPPQGGALGK